MKWTNLNKAKCYNSNKKCYKRPFGGGNVTNVITVKAYRYSQGKPVCPMGQNSNHLKIIAIIKNDLTEQAVQFL